MGSKYEVSIWVETSTLGQYAYETVWRGETRKEALKIMDEYAKKTGCVKLEYRP